MDSAEDLPRLLIVDDDPLAARMIGGVGERCGYAVMAAATEAEAVAALDEWKPHAIVLDVAIGNSDAIEVMSRFKRKQCRAPIVVISAYGDHYLIPVTRYGAANGLRIAERLSKPLHLPTLENTLRELVAADPSWRRSVPS